jgi:hypothetical protein
MDKATAAAIAAVTLGAMSAQAGVRKGMTEAQVVKEMGQPNQQSELNGHPQWIYVHMTVASAILGQFSLHGPDVLSLTFNHGRVASIEHDR